MKITTILIYATFLIYANLSFAKDENHSKKYSQYLYGAMKNLIIHDTKKQVSDITALLSDSPDNAKLINKREVVIINFWATWCPPCLEEMPSLNKLVNKINSEDFSVIIIASGRQSEKKIATFLEDNKLSNLKSYRDPKGEAASELGIIGLPTSIIIDQQSNEIGRLIGGANWNSPPAIKLIRSILDPKKLTEN